MRDEFPLEVKRVLAGRAGHKCSVCEKPTSGPAATSELALSDGVAAHITAASPGGPRFDPSLSSDERRAAKNGIWVCTQHGREIDANTSSYSVEVLRARKRIREEAAARELQQRGGQEDESAVLLELPYVATIYKLFEVIAPQPYTYPTTSGLRDVLGTADHPSQILDLAPEVIVGTWDSHPNVAGILSTLLSNNLDYWQPTPQVLTELEALCSAAIDADEWTRVASVEPLAFAIAAKGRPDVHRKVLERLIGTKDWRDADSARIQDYYGNVGVEIASIFRHWNDPFRKGLLRANDVARLIDLLLSHDRIFERPLSHQTLLDLLVDQAKVLSQHGAPELARSVNALAETLRSLDEGERPTTE